MKSLTQSSVRTVTSGDLTERITFESEARGADGYGGFTSGWSQVAEAWALVEPLFVGERDQQGASRNVTQYRFTLYRRDDITEQMRIAWNGRTHNIRGIRIGGAREMFMDIITETGAGD